MQECNNLPLMIKTGNDIVFIPRIKKIINKFGINFLKKILIEDEITYCINKNIININAVAKRFSAKEALVKALGIGFGTPISFKDIGVINDINNKPYLKLSDKITDFIYNNLRLKNFSVDLSLSDDKDYAIAIVAIIGYKEILPHDRFSS